MQIFNSFVRIGWKKKVADLLKKGGGFILFNKSAPFFNL